MAVYSQTPQASLTQPGDAPMALSEIVKSADRLAQLRKDAEVLRADDVRDWAFNREFYKGNQWVYWNWRNKRIERLPDTDGDQPRYKVRLKNNRIKRGTQRWIAQMSKNKPVIYAAPNTPSDRDRKAAEMAQGLYEHLWRELSLTTELQRALLYSALSQGYWKIGFDPLAGKPQRHIVNPATGAPIDGPLAEVFLESIPQAAAELGVPEEQVRRMVELVTYEGEISVEAMPGENVIVDPTAPSHERAKWAICIHYLTSDEIRARWGRLVPPDSVPVESTPALMFEKTTDKRPKNVRPVFIGYFVPQPALPEGCYVVWIENPHEILYAGPWQFPFNELPLIKFPGHESTTGPLDIPPATDARPLQKELNNTISQIVEFKNLTLNPQMVAPVGSLVTRLTREPGAVFEYNPVAGLTPEWRPMPQLQRYIFDHLALIKAELDDVFNAMPNQRDQLPARIDSPGSIDLIQESVADQLLPPIRRLEESLAKAGHMLALMAQRFYTEERLIKVKGTNGSLQAKKFRAADLQGGYSFHAEAGSALPRTREGKIQRAISLYQAGLITPIQVLKMIDMPDFHGLQARIEADEDHALREHDKMIRGEPLNVQAVAEVTSGIQALLAGGTPPEGMEDAPVDDPEMFAAWAEQTILQASLMPLPYENLEAHERVHREYLTTPEFETLPFELQQRFILHYQITQQMIQQNQMMQAPPEPPRINLGLKATTSVPVAAEILRRSGIPVTDEQVAEPAMETWVTDSMDKVDRDEAGNDPLSDFERMQSMQQSEEMHALRTAKAAHDLSVAQRNAQRAEEEHAARLRSMTASQAEATSRG